jgi:hypothetical protein
VLQAMNLLDNGVAITPELLRYVKLLVVANGKIDSSGWALHQQETEQEAQAPGPH